MEPRTQKFKCGDVVQLKSGGPWMTVTHVHDKDDLGGIPDYECCLATHDGAIIQHRLREHALKTAA